MPEKTSRPARSRATSFAIGVGLAILFGVGILIPGAAGIVSAVVGGTAGAISLRGIRLANKNIRGMAAGLLYAFVPGVVLPFAIALLLDIVINQIALLGWMVVFGATNVIIYDHPLARWMVRVFPRQFPDGIQVVGDEVKIPGH